MGGQIEPNLEFLYKYQRSCSSNSGYCFQPLIFDREHSSRQDGDQPREKEELWVRIKQRSGLVTVTKIGRRKRHDITRLFHAPGACSTGDVAKGKRQGAEKMPQSRCSPIKPCVLETEELALEDNQIKRLLRAFQVLPIYPHAIRLSAVGRMALVTRT